MYQHSWLCSNTNWVQKLYIDVEGERVKFPFHTVYMLFSGRCWGPAFNRAVHMIAVSVVQGPAFHENFTVCIGTGRLLNTTSKPFRPPLSI